MRTILIFAALLLAGGCFIGLMAQEGISGDAAATYQLGTYECGAGALRLFRVERRRDFGVVGMCTGRGR